MATEKRGEWCAFKGFGQWDCDDAPCESAGSFAIGGFGAPAQYVCVRHMGYAIAADCAAAEQAGDAPATVLRVERVL